MIKLNNVLKKYYDKGEKIYSQFRYDKDEKEFEIDKEVTEFFKANNIQQFNVSIEGCYDSCGYSCNMLCCAWVDEQNKLHTNYTLLEFI